MIQEYINSGILEAYVMGSASPEEVDELLHMKAEYPEVSAALHDLETDMERIARHMAVTPPHCTWDKIADHIDELMRQSSQPAQLIDLQEDKYKNFGRRDSGGPQYIEVEAESNHMKVHKVWKTIFIGVFILGKIFLACAIYFYLENRQAQQQLKDLKIELRQLKK
ncbi:hypothetical protein GWR56_08070 [Mucilaginibacter sp. 14171R-50]|uniref:hypothetical protein n=1 Tax=Mucilaginibacter sp. 14171R-50 TaxID=2703789 RepID=UPI00138D5B0B|nr:hypothetical protein [Mucilaginibacter sp. 14171R-50]QHS55497.1 hypothetical protein GWR56_08070 [Mucilaginibacter sp. 14171R-50]